MEQIEATGLRYRVTERANNIAVGGLQGANGGGTSGLDLITPFTREFWNFKGRKRRARTLEVLKAYGDSTVSYTHLALDSGTNPPAVEDIIRQIKDYTLGYKLPGAGGGGYLYMVAKDSQAALRIRCLLYTSL